MTLIRGYAHCGRLRLKLVDAGLGRSFAADELFDATQPASGRALEHFKQRICVPSGHDEKTGTQFPRQLAGIPPPRCSALCPTIMA